MSDTRDEMASNPSGDHATQGSSNGEPAQPVSTGPLGHRSAKPDGIVTVTAQDVLASGGSARETAVTLGTFTQVAGLRLAAGVGALAAVVTIALLGRAIWAFPVAPQLTSQMTKEQLDTLMSAQKQNYDLVINAMTTLFEAVIVKVLLPVFTSILGYIFGAQMSRGSNSRD